MKESYEVYSNGTLPADEKRRKSLKRSQGHLAWQVSREKVQHVGRTMRRLNREEKALHEGFLAEEEAAKTAPNARERVMARLAMAKLSAAMDALRERRRVLLMIPRPGSMKELARGKEVIEVRPAEILDSPEDYGPTN